jgi:uncharacterized protein (UPF0276 family)
LLAKAYEHFGVFPTLLERDFNIPSVDELFNEVDSIHQMQKQYGDKRDISIAQQG